MWFDSNNFRFTFRHAVYRFKVTSRDWGISSDVFPCWQENTGNVRLLNAAMVNGYSIVTYQRPLKAQDELDLDILINGTQPIIWAIGPLNSRNEVSYHSLTNKSAFRNHPLYTVFVGVQYAAQLWNIKCI